MKDTDWVPVGRIGRVFGVRGWVKVISFTDPVEEIFEYSPWRLQTAYETREFANVAVGHTKGSELTAKLATEHTREEARALTGATVLVKRTDFAALEAGEYYWVDLIGLRVVGRNGFAFGHVKNIMETGANDVLVVAGERERLVPFVLGDVVLDVDIAGGLIQVDWDEEF